MAAGYLVSFYLLWLSLSVGMPVGVGFGIRDAASAVAVAQVADAVVIGSRLIQEMEATPRERAVEAVEALVREIRSALDGGFVRAAA